MFVTFISVSALATGLQICSRLRVVLRTYLKCCTIDFLKVPAWHNLAAVEYPGLGKSRRDLGAKDS